MDEEPNRINWLRNSLFQVWTKYKSILFFTLCALPNSPLRVSFLDFSISWPALVFFFFPTVRSGFYPEIWQLCSHMPPPWDFSSWSYQQSVSGQISHGRVLLLSVKLTSTLHVDLLGEMFDSVMLICLSVQHSDWRRSKRTNSLIIASGVCMNFSLDDKDMICVVSVISLVGNPYVQYSALDRQ